MLINSRLTSLYFKKKSVVRFNWTESQTWLHYEIVSNHFYGSGCPLTHWRNIDPHCYRIILELIIIAKIIDPIHTEAVVFGTALKKHKQTKIPRMDGSNKIWILMNLMILQESESTMRGNICVRERFSAVVRPQLTMHFAQPLKSVASVWDNFDLHCTTTPSHTCWKFENQECVQHCYNSSIRFLWTLPIQMKFLAYAALKPNAQHVLFSKIN